MLIALVGCSKQTIEKPENLISKQTMEDILYDIALLESIRSHQPGAYDQATNATSYIYEKYQIDSLQFVNSNAYYTSNLEGYRKMYENVTKRLDQDIKNKEAELESGQEKQPLGDEPRIQ